jgi:hypothetical protein
MARIMSAFVVAVRTSFGDPSRSLGRECPEPTEVELKSRSQTVPCVLFLSFETIESKEGAGGWSKKERYPLAGARVRLAREMGQTALMVFWVSRDIFGACPRNRNREC